MPDARVGLAQCLAAIGYYYNAYKEYQTLIDKNPNSDYFDMALQRQFDIGNLFLSGERVKFMGVRLLPGLDKAVDIFEQTVKNGPYSKVGPAAQYHLGLAHEKQKEYLSAVKAYELLIDRYPQDPLAEVAQFAIGLAYKQEAGRAEYDQDMANKSITAFTDYLVRYPKGDRAPLALRWRNEMQLEQAYGLYRIGQFYEKQHATKAAIIYYNAVIEQNPRTPAASAAQKRLAMLEPMPTRKHPPRRRQQCRRAFNEARSPSSRGFISSRELIDRLRWLPHRLTTQGELSHSSRGDVQKPDRAAAVGVSSLQCDHQAISD